MRITYIDPFQSGSKPFVQSLVQQLELWGHFFEIKPFKTVVITHQGRLIPCQLTTPLKPFFTTYSDPVIEKAFWPMTIQTLWFAVDEALGEGTYGVVSPVKASYMATSEGCIYPHSPWVLKEGKFKAEFSQQNLQLEHNHTQQTPHIRTSLNGAGLFIPNKPSLLIEKKTRYPFI